MTITYIEAIAYGFPAVQCHAVGDGSDYSTIVWDSGAALPTQETLDSWIAANPTAGTVEVGLTKYQFRQLFTFSERVAIDSFEDNTSLSDSNKAIIRTFLKDLELSGEVFLSNVASGMYFLESVGLIGEGRAAEVVAGQSPA